MKEKISISFGILVGSITSFILGLSFIMKVLLLLMVIDYVLGVVGAIIEKRLSSNEIFKGGLRKGIVLLVIIVGYYLSRLVHTPILLDMVIMYYVSMEILSIFEHVVASGVKLPQFLVKFVKLLNEQNDDVEIPK